MAPRSVATLCVCSTDSRCGIGEGALGQWGGRTVRSLGAWRRSGAGPVLCRPPAVHPQKKKKCLCERTVMQRLMITPKQNGGDKLRGIPFFLCAKRGRGGGGATKEHSPQSAHTKHTAEVHLSYSGVGLQRIGDGRSPVIADVALCTHSVWRWNGQGRSLGRNQKSSKPKKFVGLSVCLS